MADVRLRPLENSDREQFIHDNQEAFRLGALEEFGELDDHFEEPGEIISRATIGRCLDREGSVALRIFSGDVPCGGMILHVDHVTTSSRSCS